MLSGLSDSTKLNNIFGALKRLYTSSIVEVNQVACFEALGFPLGAIVAQDLKVGLVLVRKAEPKYTSPDFETETFRDYDKEQKTFKVLKSSIPRGTRILIVDDLCETGEQLRAATMLFTRLGAIVIGAVFIGCRLLWEDKTCYNFPIYFLSDEDIIELLPYY